MFISLNAHMITPQSRVNHVPLATPRLASDLKPAILPILTIRGNCARPGNLPAGRVRTIQLSICEMFITKDWYA